MDNINVLIIEDTPAQSDRLVSTLEENNFNVVGVVFRIKVLVFYKYLRVLKSYKH